MSCDSLTSDLSLKLQQTSLTFKRWADNRVDELESSDMTFEQTIEDCECTMDALRKNENNLENLRIRQNAIKDRQQKEIVEIERELETLNKQKSDLQPDIQRLQEEEIMMIQKYDRFKKDLLESRQARDKALNDLTKGIQLYQKLGLQFEKAQNDCMKFTFTQIDPQYHSRRFEFLLLVDDEDCYQLMDSNPALDPDVCKAFVIQLNEDNDIARFVVNMRREYRRVATEYLRNCI